MTLPGGTSADIRPRAELQTGSSAGRARINERQPAVDDLEGREPGTDGAPARYAERPAPDFSQWPLRSHLILGALPSAVPCSRLHARQVAWEWQLGHLSDAVELVVSELVTNGVRACEGLTSSRYAGCWAPGRPPVRLWLHGQQRRIAVQVWDGSDQQPARQPADPGAESGRGLLLVESVSDAWGSYRPPRSSGKVVWATLH
jgi:hypothetical protein